MITRLTVCVSPGTDPYENLALEQTLLERVWEGECILYLWQNARTVVIGRNQNPWKECRTALLAEEGGRLARRLSGGGAVFHDLGNLNFTFLMREEDYDLDRQLSVIELACRCLGIPAERSGRNDLLCGGRKFSGNAFYHHNGRAYHHGTLMVDVDLDMVPRYLSPSRAKLAAKGVDSVRSRVVNLREFNPELTVRQLSDALVAAFSAVYGINAVGAHSVRPPEAAANSRQAAEKAFPLRGRQPEGPDEAVPVHELAPEDFDLAELSEKYRSEAWLYGPKMPFTVSAEDRFTWGGVEIRLDVNEGVIQAAKVYTDAMDETLAQKLETVLPGCSFRFDSLSEALDLTDLSASQKTDLISLLRKTL